MKEHADSRDFKPNNDLDGLKKKERHEAYFTYLTAIKEALIEKGELPKRLNLWLYKEVMDEFLSLWEGKTQILSS